MDESAVTQNMESLLLETPAAEVGEQSRPSSSSSLKRKADSLEDPENGRPHPATGPGISFMLVSRMDGQDSNSIARDPEPIHPETCARLARDPDFFLDDGTVVFLVHDVYFKVHQSRIARDSSIFSDMFTLPQSGAAEGKSLERPIRLAEKPRRFSALMWSLYALPAELRNISTDAENVPKLIDIATAAQKYQFKTTEEWALTCLIDIVRASHDVNLKKINPWRIFGIAEVCNNTTLRGVMILKIKEKANAGKLPYSWVLTIAESLDIKELIGESYYKLVIRGQERWHEDPKLTFNMIQNLYVGFARLVAYHDKFFQAPLPIVNHECLGVGQCRARWALVWKEGQDVCRNTNVLPSVDVPGQVQALLNYCRTNRTYPGPCHDAWCASVQQKFDELSKGVRLLEFFRPRPFNPSLP